MKINLFRLLIPALSFLTVPIYAQAQCDPQCIPYARSVTGLTWTAGTDGGVVELWDKVKAAEQSNGRSYSSLRPTVNSMMLIDPFQGVINSKYGHTVAVKSVTRRGSIYQLVISQSNAQGNCGVETNISAKYYPDTNEVRFEGGYFDRKTFKVKGFINSNI